MALTYEVFVNLLHGVCEEHTGIFPLCRWRLFGSKHEHFIHTDVKRISTKRINDFIHQLINYRPKLGIKWILFATINSFIVLKCAWREIKLRIDRKQWKRLSLP